MPHIIVEYSDNLSSKVDVQNLVEQLQDSLAAQGVDKSRIKSRAVKLEHYAVGDQGKDGVMVHVTLLLLEGRDAETKQRYAHPLHDIVRKALPEAAVTLEVRDMASETYMM